MKLNASKVLTKHETQSYALQNVKLETKYVLSTQFDA
jgi:hypothetical protein